MSASASARQRQAQNGWLNDLTLRAISVSIFIALFIEFYWTTLRTKFRVMAGDEADAIVIATLHEHVYQSLLGRASLLNPPFYFPTQGVLGFTDAFLLNQIFYAPLRAMGVEQLLAIQLMWMTLSVIGGAAFALLLHRFFLVRIWLAILSAAIFAFGHALYMKIIHSQHLAIHFLPIVGLLALSALLRERPPTKTAMFAFAAGLLFGMVFTTGFYMPWFFTFFLLLAFPIFAFCYWTKIVEYWRPHRRRLIVASVAAVVGFGIGAALLLSIYGPAIATLRGLSTNQYLVTAATFRDIINVSDGNLLWGALLRATHLIPLERLQMTEVHLAVTPLLVLTTITGTVLLLRDRQRTDYGRMAAALCVAILFGYVMLYVLTISFRGTTSLFLLVVQKIVPGAIAIRVGFRSQVVSAMFITLAFAVMAEAYLRRAERRDPAHISAGGVRTLAIFLVGGVLALEQVDLRSLSFADREREVAIVASAPSPPASCRAFAIYNDGSRKLQAIHIDAMRLAQRFGIPTLNGYSGGNPPGWDFGNVWEPNYIYKLKMWARAKGLAGPLCLYDASVKTWRDLGSAPF
jgi:hypothetical protein